MTVCSIMSFGVLAILIWTAVGDKIVNFLNSIIKRIKLPNLQLPNFNLEVRIMAMPVILFLFIFTITSIPDAAPQNIYVLKCEKKKEKIAQTNTLNSLLICNT